MCIYYSCDLFVYFYYLPMVASQIYAYSSKNIDSHYIDNAALVERFFVLI